MAWPTKGRHNKVSLAHVLAPEATFAFILILTLTPTEAVIYSTLKCYDGYANAKEIYCDVTPHEFEITFLCSYIVSGGKNSTGNYRAAQGCVKEDRKRGVVAVSVCACNYVLRMSAFVWVVVCVCGKM